MCFINTHCHSDMSNLRLLDALCSVEELLITAAKQNYKGIAITEHESVASHVQAIKKTRELKQKGKIPEDFKLILGNELYLINSIEDVKDNYKSGVTKFPHFLIMSKDKEGHEQLRYLSSLAWKNSFYTGTMERVPTVKSDLERVVKENPGHILASSACLGSEVNIHLLAIRDAETNNDLHKVEYHRVKLHEFITWCIHVFGKDGFFIELQPALSNEQIYCNQKLIGIADYYGLKRIISTDTHYLRPEDRDIHKAFLNAKDGEREVDDFYEACFLQTRDEIYERMHYIDKNIVDEALQNTLLIGKMTEDYTIEHETVIPQIELPEFEIRYIFKPAYNKYDYINQMSNSENEQDRYIIKLIEDGFEEYIPYNTLTREKFHEILARINIELGELWEISKVLNQAMSAYYITVREIINVIWEDDCGNSLVGSGRGSSSGYLVCFLLGITQINPLEYGVEMPHWRHLHRSRPDIGALDIDIDTEGGKRPQIIQALKRRFGDSRILQVCTFGTEGSKSAVQTAARGLGIDSDASLYISGLIPFERGSNWPLSDCLYGNKEKDRKPVREFINEINKYPGLKETALKIEGKINKRSIHAGGVILFNEDYYKSNALMKAPNGLPITQFNLDDSQAVGNIKFDLLTIEALDKIRTTLNLLLEYGEIEWQGSLRKTFNKYLHPEVIERDDPRIYKMLGDGSVMDLFQFSTDVGYQSAIKVKPSNLLEMASANSLMRLMASDGEEQPIDIFIKHKNNINVWFNEMKEYGLTEDEIEIMKKHLLKLNGVADTQESVMLLVMDSKVANFSVKDANKLRKAIAKKRSDVLKEVQEMFFDKGRAIGTSDNLLNYVWNVEIKRQIGYSFSILHTLAYSVIALQELNLNYHFNPLYWNTACLTVNSGGMDDEEVDAESDSTTDDTEEDEQTKKSRSTNYGKVAAAIGTVRSRGVTVALPDINKAGFGFIPDLENNSIIFGLKGLNGIGDDICHAIIENRPYKSVDDFITRMYDTSIIKKGQTIQLIKAGCFDSFGDREIILRHFIALTSEPKSKLTMQNFNMLLENGLIPESLGLYVNLHRFKNYISKRVYKTIAKPKDKLLKLDDISTQFFNEHFTDESVVDYDNGHLIISEVKFKKEYEKLILPIREWISKQETLDSLNKKLFLNEWEKYCSGGISKWEMDSLSYYYHDHELFHVNREKYGISNFNTLPEQPVIVDTYQYRGREIKEYDVYRIIGTVLDKDKNKNTISLLTPEGVVTVKFYSGAFNHYNKQISQQTDDGKKKVLEKSWFSRGNKLLISGFRRENNFIPKVYKNSIYNHTVALIRDIDGMGNLYLTTERTQV